MKTANGNYIPENITEGTPACESCLNPKADTVRFTGLDGRTFDVCIACWWEAGHVRKWHSE